MKSLKAAMFWILKRFAAGAFLVGGFCVFAAISFSIGSLFYWAFTHPVPGLILFCFVLGYLSLVPEKKPSRFNTVLPRRIT
jgi:uncharacterized membrane protein YdcZ (DUF606 family)